jgi:hypothetical protein
VDWLRCPSNQLTNLTGEAVKEEITEKYERVKEHVKKHREGYFVGALGLAGITWLIMREPRTTPLGGVDRLARESTGSFNSARSLFGSASNKVVTTIHNGSRGHPGFITRCIETGDQFETQTDAARFFGIPVNIMSQHLNRGRDLAEGLHFERVPLLTA